MNYYIIDNSNIYLKFAFSLIAKQNSPFSLSYRPCILSKLDENLMTYKLDMYFFVLATLLYNFYGSNDGMASDNVDPSISKSRKSILN